MILHSPSSFELSPINTALRNVALGTATTVAVSSPTRYPTVVAVVTSGLSTDNATKYHCPPLDNQSRQEPQLWRPILTATTYSYGEAAQVFQVGK